MPTVRLADGDLNYSLEGPAGAPVLLLSNSLGTDLGMWDTQIPALTAHFRVLRYDTRGHGASLVTPGPYAIGQLGADVLALLDALELPRVHFCGLSMGGLIGQWLGIHAGERLGRLVLCNTAATWSGTCWCPACTRRTMPSSAPRWTARPGGWTRPTRCSLPAAPCPTSSSAGRWCWAPTARCGATRFPWKRPATPCA
ncbi:alpha/beta fold hydrolase [Pseudomonas aeruginosa]|uniref:alpha/beta fold hydrolase n=1 Tax=Pseudomonas aeruginosa TaxID=287 RepID=UPI0031B6F87E